MNRIPKDKSLMKTISWKTKGGDYKFLKIKRFQHQWSSIMEKKLISTLEISSISYRFGNRRRVLLGNTIQQTVNRPGLWPTAQRNDHKVPDEAMVSSQCVMGSNNVWRISRLNALFGTLPVSWSMLILIRSVCWNLKVSAALITDSLVNGLVKEAVEREFLHKPSRALTIDD